MKVLWIVNTLLPEAASLLNKDKEFKSSGGWLIGAANSLSLNDKIELFIATVNSCVTELKKLKGLNISYYVIPYGKGNIKYNVDYEAYWNQINESVQPDIIHIHGTEYSHGLAYVNACGNKNVVVSIQGLKSAYYYYHYGITNWEVFKNITLHDIFSRSMFKEKRLFKQSGELEKDLIKKIHYIIGRTSWDRCRTWAINPEAIYYFCNETLRDEFYDGSRWSYNSCSKHTIFLSQANYAIKGLHQVLKAMPIILRHYPDTIIRVAGGDLTRFRGVKGWIHYNGYMKYINGLIDKYNLRENIVFTGPLNAEEMKCEYLKCNVFVCPSTIENSPNSIGEAQILGVPCVSSYVGGAMDMMNGNENNLYRFEEIEMLAYKICEVFKNESNQVNMHDIAFIRHNPETNKEQLLKTYQEILKS